jgi:two-component system, LytTR family, sensor histidine kinase AlgZ
LFFDVFWSFSSVPSINQNSATTLLPNFRNLGVMLRILVGVTGLTFFVAAVKASNWSSLLQQWVGIVALAQPITIFSLLVLAFAGKWLRTLEYRVALALIVLLEILITLGVTRFGAMLFGLTDEGAEREMLMALTMTLLLAGYFNLRNRALSPAMTESRLQALQARIRPHFLFNSINAVLSLMRAEPRRAETVLEDLADLFRVLMADNRDLLPLANEVQLCKQYLDIEKLRLGDRLQVQWQLENMPGEALVPPLLLQPLVENAVYHGIEPSINPGVVSLNIYRVDDQVHMILRNPYRKEGSRHSGNKMALENIRERLALHFDAEASLQTRAGAEDYEVHIVMPYVTENS